MFGVSIFSLPIKNCAVVDLASKTLPASLRYNSSHARRREGPMSMMYRFQHYFLIMLNNPKQYLVGGKLLQRSNQFSVYRVMQSYTRLIKNISYTRKHGTI